jgi:glycogen synthase
LATSEITETSSAPLHVLLLGPYPPPYGGVEICIVGLRAFLLRQGHSCEVINLTRHRQADADGVLYPNSALKVLWLLLRRRADIVHLHIGGDVRWRLLYLGFIASLIPGRKAVLTLHSGGYPSSPEGKEAKPNTLRGFLFRRFAGLIAVNREIGDLFERFGVERKRIRLILPFALPSAVPDGPLPQAVQSFFDTHKPILLSVNGLEAEYDLPLQIDALRELLPDWPNAGLVIMGKGSLEKEIRHQIAAKSYADHILLVGDVLHEVVLQAMSRADVLLRTTHYDGDSIAVREALHLGLPVVATDTGMRPEGVILMAASNGKALREAIGRGLAMPSRRSSRPVEDLHNLYAVVKFYRELQEY